MKRKNKILKGLFAISLLFCQTSPSFFGNASFYESCAAAETRYVIPGGEPMGVILNCKGVLVSGIADLPSAAESPAKKAGVKEGDIIISAGGKQITSVDGLNSAVSASEGKSIEISAERDGKKQSFEITPAYIAEEKKYCLGLWVKDTASGIGTVTYYDPQKGSFAMLGHGISNPETGEIFPLSGGIIVDSEIVSVTKGKKGIPGELKGTFYDNGETEGEIRLNNSFGVFGKLKKTQMGDKKPMELGKTEDIQKGAATVYATLSGNSPEEYSIEILRINHDAKNSNKSMLIKVTDERLKNISGGIVQGMSGCPIIQNGKLIGAVTHVFVNDPEKGYGVFIEKMNEYAEALK